MISVHEKEIYHFVWLIYQLENWPCIL